MYGIEIPKQRGIFSEILTTEDTENLNVSDLRPPNASLTTIFASIESLNLWSGRESSVQGQ